MASEQDEVETADDANEQSEDEIIAEMQKHIAEASARKSAKAAKASAQSVIHKSVPLDTHHGEWDYVVRNGDVLRFPGGVHKVDS